MADVEVMNMNLIKKFIRKITEYNEAEKYKYQVSPTLIILGIVLLFMSMINIISKEYQLLIFTGAFGLLFLLLGFLIYKNLIPKAVSDFFIYFSIIFLFSYFIITGHPQGFSIIWLLIIPSIALYLFGIKKGSILSLLALAILLFLFYLPWGRELLLYNYNEAFLVRTPIAYITFYIISLFLEFLRITTEKALKDERKKYYYLSTHDPLTKTYNRLALNDIIEENFLTKTDISMAFLICDIDDFKKINDTYGHKAGDKVLTDFASILEKHFHNGYVSRWGGEEFAIIFSTLGVDFANLTSTCFKAIDKHKFTYGDNNIHVTASVGLAYTNQKKVDYDALFIYADELLYKAKSTGKNKIVIKEFK